MIPINKKFDISSWVNDQFETMVRRYIRRGTLFEENASAYLAM